MILGKNSTGNNGTSGKVGKNVTLALYFPKPPTLKPQNQTPTINPNIENVPFLPDTHGNTNSFGQRPTKTQTRGQPKSLKTSNR